MTHETSDACLARVRLIRATARPETKGAVWLWSSEAEARIKLQVVREPL